MSRFLLFCLAFTLTGCAYSVQGDPVPGAVTPTTTSDVLKIPAVREIANADPCAFLTVDDFRAIGPYRSQPARRDGQIPHSCGFVLNDGSEKGVTAVTAVYQRYQEVRAKQTKGREVFVERYSTWLTCGPVNDDMVCTAVVAVHTERTLLVALAMRGATEDKVVKMLEPLTKAALTRLPAG